MHFSPSSMSGWLAAWMRPVDDVLTSLPIEVRDGCTLYALLDQHTPSGPKGPQAKIGPPTYWQRGEHRRPLPNERYHQYDARRLNLKG
jgi:hypothetical protein